jgi:hypothetical protein
MSATATTKCWDYSLYHPTCLFLLFLTGLKIYFSNHCQVYYIKQSDWFSITLVGLENKQANKHSQCWKGKLKEDGWLRLLGHSVSYVDGTKVSSMTGEKMLIYMFREEIIVPRVLAIHNETYPTQAHSQPIPLLSWAPMCPTTSFQ